MTALNFTNILIEVQTKNFQYTEEMNENKLVMTPISKRLLSLQFKK